METKNSKMVDYSRFVPDEFEVLYLGNHRFWKCVTIRYTYETQSKIIDWEEENEQELDFDDLMDWLGVLDKRDTVLEENGIDPSDFDHADGDPCQSHVYADYYYNYEE